MGYELWPELGNALIDGFGKSSRLGYELWPELIKTTSRLGWSLVDWDMSSGRNPGAASTPCTVSLVDWDMSSGRNTGEVLDVLNASLVDWDMSSGRRRWLDRRFAPVKPTPAPRRDVYQDWKSANRRIQYVALTLLFS